MGPETRKITKLSMQIIGGKYRHRKLHSSPGDTTRPITARVKVSLFDRLQPRLQDARVADIYSGTGTIGFEALSRGAQSVVFFEQDRVAFDLLKQNVAELKAEDETFCWRTDATKSSFRPHGDEIEKFVPYDVVFYDPPYKHIQKMSADTMMYKSLLRLAKPTVTSPDVLLVVRCARRAEFTMPPVWQLEQLLEYSSMHVYLYRLQAREEGAEQLAEEVEAGTLEASSGESTVSADEQSENP